AGIILLIAGLISTALIVWVARALLKRSKARDRLAGDWCVALRRLFWLGLPISSQLMGTHVIYLQVLGTITAMLVMSVMVYSLFKWGTSKDPDQYFARMLAYPTKASKAAPAADLE